MSEKRNIGKWDRRRANKRLKRFMKKEENDAKIKSVDEVHVRLPELNDNQKKRLDENIKSKKDVRIEHFEQ